MQALTIFEAMLTAAAPVVAIVGARIYPLELPQTAPAVPLPAIVTRLVSDDGLPTLDAAAGYQMRSAIVELHLVAKSITALYSLRQAVGAACDFQRGTFAGLFVNAVQPGRDGATETDSALGVWYQPITFSITYKR